MVRRVHARLMHQQQRHTGNRTLCEAQTNPHIKNTPLTRFYNAVT